MLAELAEMTRLFLIFSWHMSCLVPLGTHGIRGQVFYLTSRRKTMKKTILAGALLSALGAHHGLAAADDAASKPDNEVTFKAGILSDYRYRGVTQSRFKPSYTAGVDYVNNPSGIFLGATGYTIKWIEDGGATDGNLEIDVYGGKRGELAPGWQYEVGGLYYWYPKNTYADAVTCTPAALYCTSNANTFELNGKIGTGPYYFQYSHSLTDLFGWKGSSNSAYYDFGADFPLADGYVLNAHVGYQKVANLSAANFTDYRLGVTKDFGFVIASAAYVAADTDKAYYVTPAARKPADKNTGAAGLVVSLIKTF
jgi:uncharacterized protein (TIGR02001 family)